MAYDPYAPPEAWQKEGLEYRRVETLDELLTASDVISLHVPLTPGTRGMIGAKQLAVMRNNAILINCSRGGIVDEAALLRKLESKGIYGAALDAMHVEPPTLEAYHELLKNENLILTPHIGAGTRGEPEQERACRSRNSTRRLERSRSIEPTGLILEATFVGGQTVITQPSRVQVYSVPLRLEGKNTLLRLAIIRAVRFHQPTAIRPASRSDRCRGEVVHSSTGRECGPSYSFGAFAEPYYMYLHLFFRCLPMA